MRGDSEGGGACLYTGSPRGGSCLCGAGAGGGESPLGRHIGRLRSRVSPGVLTGVLPGLSTGAPASPRGFQPRHVRMPPA